VENVSLSSHIDVQPLDIMQQQHILRVNVRRLGKNRLSRLSRFLPREAMLSAVYAVVVCLCVCDGATELVSVPSES